MPGPLFTVAAFLGVRLEGGQGGVFAAALYDPLWTSAVLAPTDFAIALVAFVVLAATRLSILAVLAGCVLASVVRDGW